MRLAPCLIRAKSLKFGSAVPITRCRTVPARLRLPIALVLCLTLSGAIGLVAASSVALALLALGVGLAVALMLLVFALTSPARPFAARLATAVAAEPDPIELFSIVAAEASVELDAPEVTVVRFEPAGFGTVVGGWHAQGTPTAVPGTTVDLDASTVAGRIYANGRPAPGGAPIRIGNKPWGVLIGESVAADRLVAVADAAAGALAYADACARLSLLGTRDPLTNLLDHRIFHEQLRAEVRRARRHDRALSLVLVNLDGFRRLNQAHGRFAGDRILGETAYRLAASVRQGEIVSRIGADHFAWILPETEGLNGWIAAERARGSISSTPFAGVGNVTASAGVIDLVDVDDADELLALAGLALVRAKSSGGDATFRYSDDLLRTADDPRDERGLRHLRELARELDAEGRD